MKNHEWHKPWTNSLGKLSRRKLSSNMSQEDRLALAEHNKRLMEEWLKHNEMTVAPSVGAAPLNPAGIPRNSLVVA